MEINSSFEIRSSEQKQHCYESEFHGKNACAKCLIAIDESFLIFSPENDNYKWVNKKQSGDIIFVEHSVLAKEVVYKFRDEIIFEAIALSISHYFDRVRIYLVSPDPDELIFISSMGHTPPLPNKKISIKTDICAYQAIQYRRSSGKAKIWRKKSDINAKKETLSKELNIENLMEWVDCPILNNDNQPIAWISVDNAERNEPIKDGDIKVLEKYIAELRRVITLWDAMPLYANTRVSIPLIVELMLDYLDDKLNNYLNPMSKLDVLVDVLRKITKADNAYIRYVDDMDNPTCLIMGSRVGDLSISLPKEIPTNFLCSYSAKAFRENKEQFSEEINYSGNIESYINIIADDSNRRDQLRFGLQQIKSFVSFPLLYNNKTIGVLTLSYKDIISLRNNHKIMHILKLVGSRAAFFVNSIIKDETDIKKKTREHLSLIQQDNRFGRNSKVFDEIRDRLQASIGEDELFNVALVSLTHGEGMGYNRALIFLPEESGYSLKYALGPKCCEDAYLQWTAGNRKLTDSFDSIRINDSRLAFWKENYTLDLNSFLLLSVKESTYKTRRFAHVHSSTENYPSLFSYYKMTQADKDFLTNIQCPNEFCMSEFKRPNGESGYIYVDFNCSPDNKLRYLDESILRWFCERLETWLVKTRNRRLLLKEGLQNNVEDCEFDVFISYSSQDSKLAQQIASSMESKGLRIWFGHNENVGDTNIKKRIKQAINNSNSFVILITSKSKDDPWIRYERELIIQKHWNNIQTRVIPIVCEDVEIPAFIASLQPVRYNTKSLKIDKLAENVADIVLQSNAELKPDTRIIRSWRKNKLLERFGIFKDGVRKNSEEREKDAHKELS